jgi:hypothetical protein
LGNDPRNTEACEWDEKAGFLMEAPLQADGDTRRVNNSPFNPVSAEHASLPRDVQKTIRSIAPLPSPVNRASQCCEWALLASM